MANLPTTEDKAMKAIQQKIRVNVVGRKFTRVVNNPIFKLKKNHNMYGLRKFIKKAKYIRGI